MRLLSKWLFFTFAVTAPAFCQLTITTPSALPNATVQSPYNQPLSVANAAGSVTWSLDVGEVLPNGLKLDSGGVISGIPTESGSFGFAIKVMDQQGRSITKGFSLQVRPPIVITTAARTLATAGSAITIVLTATGGTLPYSWQLAQGSQFPSWLRLDPQNASFLTGTPPAAGVFSFTVEASDSSQSVPATKLLTVDVQPPLSITTASLTPSGAVGVGYSLQLAVSGGVGPYTWVVDPTTLIPPGLALNPSTGVLSGVPQFAGTFLFAVRVTDSLKATVSKTFSLAIGPSSSQGALISSASLEFTAPAGGDAPSPQSLSLISSLAQPLQFTVQMDAGTANSPAPAWLSVKPLKVTTPAGIHVSVDQSGLAPGKYVGRILFINANFMPTVVNVTLTVEAVVPKLDVSPNFLRFSGAPNSSSTFEQDVILRNIGGGGPINFRASPFLGSAWLSVLPTSGQARANAPAVLRVVVNTQGLPRGATRGVIHIDSDAGNTDIPVSLLVRDDGPVIGLSQGGVRFDAREGNGSSGARNVNVLNLGQGAVNWTAELVAGAAWLALGQSSGSATPGVPNRLTLSATPGSLRAGSYYGLVKFTDPRSLNSPQFLTAVLNVADPAVAPAPDPFPAGLVFVGRTAGQSTAAQSISVNASSTAPAPFQVSANTLDGADWLSVSPASGVTSTQNAAQVSVTANPATLAPGVYRGDVSFAFSSTSIRTANITLVVLPAATGSSAAKFAAGCSPARLSLTQTGLVNNFASPAGWPTPLIVRLTDDCGDPVLNGQVVATFSNGDPPLPMRLSAPDTGLYSATWSPGSISNSMTVTGHANAPSLQSATADITGSVTANKVPSLDRNGTLNNVTHVVGAPLAPGMVTEVYGHNLAPSSVEPGVVPLPKTFNGTRVLIGGIESPFYYLSDRQLNIQIPTELEPNKEYSIFAEANGGYTVPDSLILAPFQPGVKFFGENSPFAQHPDYSLITTSAPAHPGEAIRIYLVGMGPTNPQVATAAQSPSAEPLARATAQPLVTIGSQSAKVLFAGLTPFAIGLYQIDLIVPDGATGDLPVVITQNGVEANATVLPVR